MHVHMTHCGILLFHLSLFTLHRHLLHYSFLLLQINYKGLYMYTQHTQVEQTK